MIMSDSTSASAQSRTDREVELAADHQDRDTDRDEADFGQQSENAAQIVGRQKNAVRARFEHHGEQNQQSTPASSGFSR